jgi:hypothetical protein
MHPSSSEQLVTTLLALTRFADSQRAIVAGSRSLEVHLELLRRGVHRSATIASCRVACGQHDVAFVVGRQPSHSLDSLMLRVLPYLKTRSVLAVWIDAEPHGRASGFRIEAGSRCGNGFILAARRLEWSPVANAA